MSDHKIDPAIKRSIENAPYKHSLYELTGGKDKWVPYGVGTQLQVKIDGEIYVVSTKSFRDSFSATFAGSLERDDETYSKAAKKEFEEEFQFSNLLKNALDAGEQWEGTEEQKQKLTSFLQESIGFDIETARNITENITKLYENSIFKLIKNDFSNENIFKLKSIYSHCNKIKDGELKWDRKTYVLPQIELQRTEDLNAFEEMQSLQTEIAQILCARGSELFNFFVKLSNAYDALHAIKKVQQDKQKLAGQDTTEAQLVSKVLETIQPSDVINIKDQTFSILEKSIIDVATRIENVRQKLASSSEHKIFGISKKSDIINLDKVPLYALKNGKVTAVKGEDGKTLTLENSGLHKSCQKKCEEQASQYASHILGRDDRGDWGIYKDYKSYIRGFTVGWMVGI
ncbi:MAG: hypothetical protein AAF195_02025 [Pseudomonadota bacterium]